MKLSDRIATLRPSATTEVKATADRMKAKGIDVIDFGPGEPDFDTPDHIKEAARRAIDDNLSHYLPVLGLPALRKAIAAYYLARYGAEHAEDEILVGCGAKSVLYLAAMSILSRGDEAILQAPYWVSFPEQIRLAGAEPVILETSERDGFVPHASRAESLCSPRTRAIVLCSPSNPTGGLIPQEEIDRFADLALRRDLYLIYDECYERFVYDGATHATPLRSDRRVRDRLLVVNAVSKTFAMTGWRVGFGLGPRDLIRAMAAIQGHDTTHPAAIAQAAAAAALSGTDDAVDAMLAEYARRREVMIAGLRDIRGLTCATPGGAFYAFPNVTGLYSRLGVKDSASVAKHLLEEAKVATVPGEPFGAPGYLRLSYALSLDRIREGLVRVRRALG